MSSGSIIECVNWMHDLMDAKRPDPAELVRELGHEGPDTESVASQASSPSAEVEKLAVFDTFKWDGP